MKRVLIVLGLAAVTWFGWFVVLPAYCRFLLWLSSL